MYLLPFCLLQLEKNVVTKRSMKLLCSDRHDMRPTDGSDVDNSERSCVYVDSNDDVFRVLHDSNVTNSNMTFVEYIDPDMLSFLDLNVSQLWQENDRFALAVFILSAVGLNNTLTPGGFKREIRLNGWEGNKHRNVQKKCCYLWTNNKTTSFVNPLRSFWKLSPNLMATQYTCPIKGPFAEVRGVNINFKKAPCPSGKDKYASQDIAQAQPKGSFAICVKIVFGDVDVKSLVHWIEYHRELKVNHIYMHIYNISSQAQTVINRYVREGFIKARPFNYPWQNGSKYIFK